MVGKAHFWKWNMWPPSPTSAELKTVLAYPGTTLGSVGLCHRVIALNQWQRLFLGKRAACDRPWKLRSQRQHSGVVNISDVTGYSIMPWPLGQQQFLMPLMLTVVISYQEFIFWCAILTVFLLSIYHQLELFQKKFSVLFSKLKERKDPLKAEIE